MVLLSVFVCLFGLFVCLERGQPPFQSRSKASMTPPTSMNSQSLTFCSLQVRYYVLCDTSPISFHLQCYANCNAHFRTKYVYTVEFDGQRKHGVYSHLQVPLSLYSRGREMVLIVVAFADCNSCCSSGAALKEEQKKKRLAA